MCLHVYMSECQCISLFMWLCVFLSVWLCVNRSVRCWLCVCVSMWLCAYVFVCVCDCLSVYMSVCQCVYIFVFFCDCVCVCVCVCVRLHVYVCVYMAACLCDCVCVTVRLCDCVYVSMWLNVSLSMCLCDCGSIVTWSGHTGDAYVSDGSWWGLWTGKPCQQGGGAGLSIVAGWIVLLWCELKQHIKELISAWKTSHKHINKAAAVTVTLTSMRVNARHINSTATRCVVEFMHLVLTGMPCESTHRQITSLLLCLLDVFRVLVISVTRPAFGVCWFGTSALGLSCAVSDCGCRVVLSRWFSGHCLCVTWSELLMVSGLAVTEVSCGSVTEVSCTSVTDWGSCGSVTEVSWTSVTDWGQRL